MPTRNPHRCKICGGLASKDGYCKPCRIKMFGKQRLPLQRDSFIPTYGPLSRTSFYTDSFSIEKDDFDFRTQGLDK